MSEREKIFIEIMECVEETLSKLQQYQVAKAAVIAQELRPDLTREDILNPDDFKELASSPQFMYEDGQAAGILSAKMAVKVALRERFGG